MIIKENSLMCVQIHTLTFIKGSMNLLVARLSLHVIKHTKLNTQSYISVCFVHMRFNFKCLKNCKHIKWIVI
jgi:hypothetical protein